MRLTLMSILAVYAMTGLPSVHASSKRGIGWPWFEGSNSSATFPAATWVYNWENWLPNKGHAQEFVVMQRTAAGIESLAAAVKRANSSTVLGMNEPDISQAYGGSDLSPAAAAKLWKQYIQPLKAQGTKLVAPAVSSSSSPGMGLSWLDAFVANCTGCTFDAYAYHPYVPDFAALKGSVDFVTAYKGGRYTPLIISEFGRSGDTVNTKGGGTFLRKAMAYLDDKKEVERYAYIARVQQNKVVQTRDLQNLDGSKTSLGKIYSP